MHESTGRRIELGEYGLSMIGRRVMIDGPSPPIARQAEQRLESLFLDMNFLDLLGKAHLHSGSTDGEREAVLAQLCGLLGLPFGVVAGTVSTETRAETPLDYDDDQDAISRIRLPEVLDRRLMGLHGLFAGFIADGSLDDREVVHLYDWCQANPELAERWPVSELRQLLAEVLADGVISDEERRQLRTFVESLADDFRMEGVPTSSIFDPNPEIVFPGKRFLLTGKLTMCTRKTAQQMIKDRGGLVAKNPSSTLDYLIVGDEGNVNFQFARYGRKIERVLNLKSDGCEILVVNERTFIDAMG